MRFEEWLRTEIEYAESLDKEIDGSIFRLTASVSANARLRALREVQLAYTRSQETQ